MTFGLEQHIIDKIISVFEANARVDKAYVFGSRAKGNYRPDSDIDIAIKGIDITLDDILKMSVAFEDKGIKNKIDLIDYTTIKEPALLEHIDRVGIELYSRWKEVKLGKLINVINGFAFKSTDFLDTEEPNSLPIIKIKNVANGDVNIEGVHFHFLSDGLKKYIVQNNDILISLTGNHPELETQVVGLVSKYKLVSKALLNQRVAKLVSKNSNELSSDYLYYFLKNKDTHLLLASQSSGSANQANISKTNIEDIPFSKPPIQEQTTIASILSSLDDKIDLLQRQNKTLEQLAETLFRQWFVEEAEESWEVGKLDDIAVFSNGKSRPNEVENGEIPIYGGNGILGYTDQSNYEGLSVIIGRVGAYCGSLYIENKPIWLSDNALIARGQKEDYTFYLFYLLKSMELNSMAEGSSHPLLTQTLLKSIDICVSPSQKVLGFNKQVSEFWTKIYANQTQIRTLTHTRDTLLPKLMSGEVRVVIN